MSERKLDRGWWMGLLGLFFLMLVQSYIITLPRHWATGERVLFGVAFTVGVVLVAEGRARMVVLQRERERTAGPNRVSLQRKEPKP